MLYIRHGEKAYKNGGSETYPLDPPLTANGKEEARHKFLQLLLLYDRPEYIVCSPFLRTRETAMIAAEVILENINVIIPIISNSNIGEYLGNQKVVQREYLREETLGYDPILKETWYEFRKRLAIQDAAATKGVWYITHGLTIQGIAKLRDKKIKHPKELCGIAIIDNKITMI